MIHPRYYQITALLTCLASPFATAADATVILSQGCEYVLLDSTQGQVLLKLIKGEPPKAGDVLRGTFRQRDFAELTIKRDGSKVSTWVDMIDRSGSKALMRYSQYCNK